MLTKGLRSTVAVALILGLALAVPCSDAFAQSHGGGHGWGGGERHYYRDGSWYRHGWFGFDIAVSALAIGAIIDSLPPRYTTVVVAGIPYYYYDHYYYRPYPYGGYVVVQPPAIAQPVAVVPQAATMMQAEPQTHDLSTINIPNSRGGYTAVTLRRSGDGFVGPQGEYYSDNPTVEQLKVLYGK